MVAEEKLLLMLILMAVCFYPALLIIRKTIAPKLENIIKARYQEYNNIFKKNKLSRHLGFIFLTIYLLFWNSLFDRARIENEIAVQIKDVIIFGSSAFIITFTLLAFINTGVEIYKAQELQKKLPIELYANIVKIFIILCSVLGVLSLVIDISISTLFTSIGAATALLTLIFKDTLLGLFASLQITFENIIQVDDWVTIPKYNIDGRVEKITISVVTIRNPDQTTTTVPTSIFLTTDVKNRRSMIEKGGRRIKRPIIIDIDTIKICDQDTLGKIKRIPYLKQLSEQSPFLFKPENANSNLAIFRHYIEYYLKNHDKIHQDGFLYFVRQLEPSSYGLPLEIYAFTKATDIINYELTQTEIFEHLLAIMPEFGLKAFQASA